ncbi:hypothetical protein DFJ74DRAFT_613150 [Hyaloraphidium curvatum]|nr:hypothetical protein DFJ74DRAFT_613150 [Hyaloraphidium curvatum]
MPPPLTPAEARAIAREAYLYGFPLVDSLRIQHAYFVSRDGPEYKCPFNSIASAARVYTPADTAVQTPNADTPYSFAGLDLRAEPVVLTVPRVGAGRYYSVQLIDAYTHNFDYLGSRATGSEGGNYMVAGPGWKGDTPEGVGKVIRCETGLCFAVYRTQLFGPDDMDAVKAVQAGYRVRPLSAFLGTEAPAAPPALEFPEPLDREAQKSSPEFFTQLAFVLGYAPAHPSEVDLRARFERLGIVPGKPFGAAALAPGIRDAVSQGMADAWADFDRFKAGKIDTGEITSAALFGTREHLADDHLKRFAGACIGIYGNSVEEALYLTYFSDAAGDPLDGSAGRHAIRFPPGGLPPVDAFWSLTMYTLPESLLYANPLERYLINSPMLPDLKKDDDGGLTIAMQHADPGEDRRCNWLPAPGGKFWVALRLYLPREEARSGGWRRPEVTRAG